MAMITVQFGQCGNQVGRDWFKLLSEDMKCKQPGTLEQHNREYIDECLHRFFTYDRILGSERYIPRAVLIDTENKVVESLQNFPSSSLYQYDPKNVVYSSGGAANNWAFGFQIKAKLMMEKIVDVIRKEVERTDHFVGFLNLLSVAGGTGSGVGSSVIERLQDDYPSKALVNAAVLPYHRGEIVTQNYNSVLTIAKLYDVSDSFFIFENDYLNKMCSSLLKINDISVEDLNTIIVQKLMAILQPVEKTKSLPVDVTDLISHLTPDQSYKLISIKTAPHINSNVRNFESSYRWSSLVDHMKENLRTLYHGEDTSYWELKQPAKSKSKHPSLNHLQCTSNLLITRGSSIVGDVGFSSMEDVKLYPNWIPKRSRFCKYHQTRRLLGFEKFIALATNSHQLCNPLNNIVQKAWDVFTHKAYLHQYKKYGVSEEDFVEAFAKVESVIKAYRDLKS